MIVILTLSNLLVKNTLVEIIIKQVTLSVLTRCIVMMLITTPYYLFLQKKEGHTLFFIGTTDAKTNALETLYNTFYIAKKGELNLANGNFDLASEINYSNLGSSNISGKIVSKNLQLLVKMQIECRENDTSFLIEII